MSRNSINSAIQASYSDRCRVEASDAPRERTKPRGGKRKSPYHRHVDGCGNDVVTMDTFNDPCSGMQLPLPPLTYTDGCGNLVEIEEHVTDGCGNRIRVG